MRRVGVTMRVTESADHREARDAISHDWIRLLAALGLEPVLLPNSLPDPGAFADSLGVEALLLTNGEDVGGETNPRDAFEGLLLDHAAARGIPVLGVCRGFQFINVRLGGRLERVAGHVARAHEVRVERPAWRERLGRDRFLTNSFHAWGVPPAALAPPLRAAATAPDGTVEAYVREDAPWFGVLWHPERPGSAEDLDRLVMAEWWAAR